MDISLALHKAEGFALPMIVQDPYPPEFEKAYEQTKEYISMFSQLCREHHIPMVLLVIPTGFQVDKSEWEAMGLKKFYSDKMFNENAVRATSQFADYAKEKGIPHLDLLPIFRQTTTRPLFFKVDYHFNKSGNQLAAQSIFSYLTTNHMISDSRDTKP